MKIKVRFFASAREFVGLSELQLDLTNEPTAADVFERLCEIYPNLVVMREQISIAVNRTYCKNPAVQQLNDGDEVIDI